MHLNSAFNGAADFSVDTRRITFCDVINLVVDILCRRQLSLDADFASQRRILGFQLKIKSEKCQVINRVPKCKHFTFTLYIKMLLMELKAHNVPKCAQCLM